MKFGRKMTAAVVATSIGGVGLVGLGNVAQASVLDREQKRCGNATVTAKLERDSREHEVDIEVYSDRGGERWRMTIKDGRGDVLRTITRNTNREGELWAWRSISGAVQNVTIDVRGPRGQSCSLKLQA
jgi:hypothetical protein